LHDSADFEGWANNPIWITAYYFSRYDLFRYENNTSCGKQCLFHNANIAPDMSVPLVVATLHMQNSHVRLQCCHK